MSGAQGLPQRMTQFVDPKTGLVSDTWWRFLNSLYSRTGGAQPTSGLDDIIQWGNMTDTAATPEPVFVDPMADTPTETAPEGAAALAGMMADTPTETPPDEALWLAVAASDTQAETVIEDGAILADVLTVMSDTLPPEPESDPALVALMVID